MLTPIAIEMLVDEVVDVALRADEAELLALVRMARAIKRRRRIMRPDRRRDRSRQPEVLEALRELRDATAHEAPHPTLHLVPREGDS